MLGPFMNSQQYDPVLSKLSLKLYVPYVTTYVTLLCFDNDGHQGSLMIVSF